MIVVEGSGNFTVRGLSKNFAIVYIWGDKNRLYPNDGSESSIELFESIWNGKEEGLLVESLDASFASKLLEIVGVEQNLNYKIHLIYLRIITSRFKNL